MVFGHLGQRYPLFHKPRQRILYAGAELNRLYPECSISMSNHAV